MTHPFTGGENRPCIMGILNVTPDSFSDGGLYDSVAGAIAHAVELREQGADIIDVGGESTRPGAERITAEQEAERVLPVISALVARGIPVSIDTMNSRTAMLAADAGVSIINDVSGGLADPEMYRVVAATGLHYIAMHWRGHLAGDSAAANPAATNSAAANPAATNSAAANGGGYDSVVTDVRTELKARIAEMIVWGISPERIILDPGLGFSKTADDNWQLLRHLPELATLGYPVLVGASRKRFLGDLLPQDAPVTDRDPATAVISTLAAEHGAWGVRVHDVRSTRAALDVWAAWHGISAADHGSLE
jgi:dihydropteroate synthase